MKRTLWLLLLLPAILVSAWAWFLGRVDDEDMLHPVQYTIELREPITVGDLFGDPGNPDAAPGLWGPSAPDLRTPKEMLSDQGITFPFGSFIYVGGIMASPYADNDSLQPPDTSIGKTLDLTFMNTAANQQKLHSLMHSTLQDKVVLQSAQPDGRIQPPKVSSAGDPAAIWGSTRYRSFDWHLQIGPRTYGIGQEVYLIFAGDERPAFHPLTIIKYAPNQYFPSYGWHRYSNRAISVYQFGAALSMPAWQFIFLALAFPALLLYLLRRPLAHILRLPLRRRTSPSTK